MTHQFGEQARYDRSRLWLPPDRTPSSGRHVIGSPNMRDDEAALPATGHLQPVPNWRGVAAVDAAPLLYGTTERAVIGDQLREVVAWCELAPCIARYTDAKALGQADVAARAIAAGWCKDAVGRLICPECQQRRPIWSAAPLVPAAKRRSASRW